MVSNYNKDELEITVREDQDEENENYGVHGQNFGSPSLSNPLDPKSVEPVLDKKEKKRLEKEKKEQEKKEKEAAKIAKKANNKENEKLKNDFPANTASQNAGKKNFASGFFASSFFKKGKSQASGIFSPKRPDVKPKPVEVKCRILLLDETEYEVNIDKYAYGQHLVDKVCDHLNILERDYFSLIFVGKRGIVFWIMHKRRIIKQTMNPEGPWDFDFRVKFYVPDPSYLQEDLTRYCLCLQLRNDIAKSKLPCTFVTSALLGSYTAQSEFGDYEPEEHGVKNPDYVTDVMFGSERTEELLQKIVDLHKTHAGQNPADADLNFLDNAKKLRMYGVHVYPAKDLELVPIGIGVFHGGIVILRDGALINRFPWPKILKMIYKKKKFYVKIRPAEFEQYENTIGFLLESHTLAKNLWKIAIEHHTFFRLKKATMYDHEKLIQFGSKHRYSGRTQFENRSMRIAREQPEFERMASKRTNASHSMAEYSLGYGKGDARQTTGSVDARYGNLEDRQIGVLAGTGSEPNKVAYVKTVKPGVGAQEALATGGEDYEGHYSRYNESGRDSSRLIVMGGSRSNDTYNNAADRYASKNETIFNGPQQSYYDEQQDYPISPNRDILENELVSTVRNPSKDASKLKKSKKSTGKIISESYTEDYSREQDQARNSSSNTGGKKSRNSKNKYYFDTPNIDHDEVLQNVIKSVTPIDQDMAVNRMQFELSQQMDSLQDDSVAGAKPKVPKKKKKSSVAEII